MVKGKLKPWFTSRKQKIKRLNKKNALFRIQPSFSYLQDFVLISNLIYVFIYLFILSWQKCIRLKKRIKNNPSPNTQRNVSFHFSFFSFENVLTLQLFL